MVNMECNIDPFTLHMFAEISLGLVNILRATKNRQIVSLEFKKLEYKGIHDEFCIFTKIGSYLEHFYVIRPPILPRITQWCPISEA